MSVIEVNGITKDYGNHQGVFDVNFTVEKGEIGRASCRERV